RQVEQERLERIAALGLDGAAVREVARREHAVVGESRSGGQREQCRDPTADRVRLHDAPPVSEPSVGAGGTGERYPTTSRSAPTTRNVPIFAPVESFERSTRNSFTTVTPSSVAAAIQRARQPRRVHITIAPSATSVQVIENADWSGVESQSASASNGTPAHWTTLRTRTPFSHRNASAAKAGAATAFQSCPSTGRAPRRRCSHVSTSAV